MRLGRQYITDVVDIDVFKVISAYDGDVLIVHGTKDKIVNIRYSKDAEVAYKARECGTVELHFIEGARHMFSKKHDLIAMQYLK